MDRLSIINDALLSTGNEQVNVEYDGSAEWRAGDAAYRRAISLIVGLHSWKFATRTVPLANRLPVSPVAHRPYAFAYPGDCLHVHGLRDGLGRPYTDFEIVDNRICCGVAAGLALIYVRIPDGEAMHPSFVEAVCIQTEANLLRSLNEDTQNARQRDADAEKEATRARTRTDQQEPARALFQSRTLGARRGRFGLGAGAGSLAAAQSPETGAVTVIVDGGEEG